MNESQNKKQTRKEQEKLKRNFFWRQSGLGKALQLGLRNAWIIIWSNPKQKNWMDLLSEPLAQKNRNLER
jgi:hypothetical protein